MYHRHRGAVLLRLWRGERSQSEVAPQLKIDFSAYCGLEKGRIEPGAKRRQWIEEGTDGAVPASAWDREPSARDLAREAKLQKRVA